MLHDRYLFRRGTLATLRCPPTGHARRVFAAMVSDEQGLCREHVADPANAG
jgi:hypothetical protein